MTRPGEPAAAAPPGRVWVNQRCEVCDGATSRPWLRLTYPQFGHPGPFELRCCDGCGLVFNSPRLDASALARLYDRNYYVFNEPVEAAWARVVALHQATVAQLETRLGAQGGRLLEVGSAKGYMLALMRDRGFEAEGIELSGHAAAHAVRAWGAPTFCGTLEQWVAQPGQQACPAVYCTDVIEHVPSPLAFARALYQAVAPGGLLLVGTPNVASDGVAQHGAHWLGFNPFHVWLFSAPTLCALLERCGFEVIEAYTFGNVALAREPTIGPVRRRLRDALARVGLLDWLRRLRTQRQPQPTAAELAAGRQRAGRQLADAPPWAASADGQHPRARSCQGDNLVVLARRPAGT